MELVSGKVLQDGVDLNGISAGVPWFLRLKAPLCLGKRYVNASTNRISVCILYVQHSAQKCPVEGFGKGENHRGIGSGSWCSQIPVFIVGRSPVGFDYVEIFPNGFDQRIAIFILHILIDDQLIPISHLERQTQFLVGAESSFDSARMKKDRHSSSSRIPEFGLQFEKGPIDSVAFPILQIDVLIDLPPLHRSGKVDVEFEKILRELIGTGEDVRNGCDCNNRRFGQGECFGQDGARDWSGNAGPFGKKTQVELCCIGGSFYQGEAGLEANALTIDLIGAQD